VVDSAIFLLLSRPY